MGGVEDFGLLHRPFCAWVFVSGRLRAVYLSRPPVLRVVLAAAGCGELLEMCFCLGFGGFSWNNRCLCPELFGVRPHSPIGRDRGLKILVFWVRVPVGALF